MTAVDAWGGWSSIFPMEISVDFKFPEDGVPKPKLDASVSKFPAEQSRVRNFFNVTPKYLTLLSSPAAKLRMQSIKGLRTAAIDAITFPFSGQVYVDEMRSRYWFQMTAAGGVYHYVGEVNAMKVAEALRLGQTASPIFKLVSPDNLGGSLEVIVKNNFWTRKLPNRMTVMTRRETIGSLGVATSVITDMVTDEVFQGSYNYAETATKGILLHEYCDVFPHSEVPGFYVNPPKHSTLETRRFERLQPIK